MTKIQIVMILWLGILLNNLTINAQTYATLPFTETFENEWINKDGTRDVPSVNWKNTPATGNNSWSRNDDGIARGAWTGEYSVNPGAANGSSHSASFNSYETIKSGTLDLYVDFGSLAGSKALYFWYANYSGDDKLEVSLSSNGGTTFGPPLITLYNTNNNEWIKACVDLGSLNSSTGVIRFKGVQVYKYSSPLCIDEVYIGSHSTTPVVADFSTDRISGMVPLTVSFTDKSTGDATNWNWDFNNDETIDATAQNPVYTFNTVGVFTTKLIAHKPEISDSKSITITVSPQIYDTLPFYEDFENEWVNRDGIRDVPSLYFRNNPCMLNSWRRSDDGKSAGWPYASSDSPAGAQNSQYYARFPSTIYTSGGTMDVFIDFSTQTGSKTLSFWYSSHSGDDKLEVYLSTDGGLTFGEPLIRLTSQTLWEKVIYDLGNITTSTGVIRFKTLLDIYAVENEKDISIDNICISNPTAVPIDAYFTSDIVSGDPPMIVNFTDKSDGAPTSWEWDFNNDGIIDATTQNPSYTYDTPGFYTVGLNIGNSNTSDTIIRTNHILVAGYAKLPYYQLFDNEWMHNDVVRNLPDCSWKNNSKYWMREDNSDPNRVGYCYYPSGANGSLHSAFFKTYSAYNETASFDLKVDFSSQTGDKRLTFWYINRGGNDTLEVFLSTDGGLTYGNALATLGVSHFWTQITVNLGDITSATGILRFMATTIDRDPTYTPIGIDEINVAVPALLPLNAAYSSNVISGNSPLTVDFTDQSDGAPTSWEWDFNNDGIVDATTQNASYTYTSAGTYDVKLVVSRDGNNDVKLNTKYILVPGYASLPFSESFEQPWISRNGFKDVPSEFAKNTPPYGNSSCSRDDEGFIRSAWDYPSWYPYLSGANGSLHSARFNGGMGTLDFYLNFSTMSGEKELSFWYYNYYDGGGSSKSDDALEVYLSTDGGVTFGSALKTLILSVAWTKNEINLGSSVSSTCVLRFKTKGNWSNSDIGLDEIKINAVEAAFKANITTGGMPLTVSFTDQSLGNPTSWEWDFNNDGIIDATIQNPVYTYTSSGTYTVKLIASKNGSADSTIKTDFIVVSIPSGTDQIVLSEKKVYVYPNPARNRVKVKLDNFGEDKTEITIFDIQGAAISTLDLTGQDSAELDFSGYARGIYFLKTYSSDQVFVNKVILQ